MIADIDNGLVGRIFPVASAIPAAIRAICSEPTWGMRCRGDTVDLPRLARRGGRSANVLPVNWTIMSIMAPVEMASRRETKLGLMQALQCDGIVTFGILIWLWP